MNRNGFARLKEILRATLAQAPSDRSAFLDETCPDDPGLRAEIESLLAMERKTDAFLETPPLTHTEPEKLAE